MTSKDERAAHRKSLSGYGRHDLLRLLLEAWDQLDAADDVCGADAIIEALTRDDERGRP